MTACSQRMRSHLPPEKGPHRSFEQHLNSIVLGVSSNVGPFKLNARRFSEDFSTNCRHRIKIESWPWVGLHCEHHRKMTFQRNATVFQDRFPVGNNTRLLEA